MSTISKNFVIFSQPRSGSTLLVDLLNSHPTIKCDGELLQPESGYIRNRRLCFLVRRYPTPFFYWRRDRCKSPVYGFKLLIYQLHYPKFVFKKLVRDNWSIIHIKRSDLFKKTISDLLAQETNHWHTTTTIPEKDYRVNISLEKLKRKLDRNLQWNEKENQLLKPYNILSINYEQDLFDSKQHQATIDQICSFLNLKTVLAMTVFTKTNQRRLEDIIINYEQLHSYFTQNYTV